MTTQTLAFPLQKAECEVFCILKSLSEEECKYSPADHVRQKTQTDSIDPVGCLKFMSVLGHFPM